MLIACGRQGTIPSGTEGTSSTPEIGAATGMSDQDKTNIATQIENGYIRQEIYFSFDPVTSARRSVSCFQYVAYNDATVTDASINGTVGKVVVTTRLTQLKPFDQAALPAGPQVCKSGTLPAGQTATYSQQYAVERWDTGWRLSANQ